MRAFAGRRRCGAAGGFGDVEGFAGALQARFVMADRRVLCASLSLRALYVRGFGLRQGSGDGGRMGQTHEGRFQTIRDGVEDVRANPFVSVAAFRLMVWRNR